MSEFDFLVVWVVVLVITESIIPIAHSIKCGQHPLCKSTFSASFKKKHKERHQSTCQKFRGQLFLRTIFIDSHAI